jgi:hypothetical protein
MLSEAQLRAAELELYRVGDLHHLALEHHVSDIEAFETWNDERQTPEHMRRIEEAGALYDNLWVDECGRRYGKTGKWLLIDYMAAVMRPQARGLIACALQKSIGEIIVPLTKVIFKDAPKGYFPRYRGTNGAEHECLVIDATGSIIKLVGIDKHPDATRGQFLDFAHISEAAFVKGLHELVTSNIMHQFQRRPWAWLAMESSTAKVPDCDFNTQFRPDAQLRGTYRTYTIADNPLLSPEEIRKEERRSGGADSPNCRRELYCEEVRDEEEMIVPEFNEATHVVDPSDWPTPRHALAYVGIDPGTTDPLGLCFAYTDFERGTLVIQGSWQRSNASTQTVASTMREYEDLFWGSKHVKESIDRREISTGAPARDVAIADAMPNGAGKFWEAPDRALTYWDATTRSLRANPFLRTSDIANRFILDLNVDHGFDVQKADKSPGSAEADILHLRFMFQHTSPQGFPRIVILKNGHTDDIIKQLRSGTWNTDETGYRTDWTRTKALGHCDCLAALKYLARGVLFNRNPMRPQIVDAAQSEIHIPARDMKKLKAPETSSVFGGRKPHRAGGNVRRAWR